MFNRVLVVDGMTREQHSTESQNVVSGNNPKCVTECRGKIHKQIEISIGEWNELKNAWHKEARKNKSRVKTEGLEDQHDVLIQLREYGNSANDERVTCMQKVLTLDGRKEEEKERTKYDHNKIE